MLGIAGLLPGCSKDPVAGKATASGPLVVEQAKVRRVEDRLLLSLSVKYENAGKESVVMKSPEVMLKSGTAEVPEYIVPFAETVTIPPGQKGKATLNYWLDQGMMNRVLKLQCRDSLAPLKGEEAFPIEKLKVGEEQALEFRL